MSPKLIFYTPINIPTEKYFDFNNFSTMINVFQDIFRIKQFHDREKFISFGIIPSLGNNTKKFS